MEYKIEGLSKKQVALLDIMWTLDDEQSVENFVRSLPTADQQQAQSLKTLLIHEALEEWLEGITEFPDAAEVIERVRRC
jgi:hypothetical protein